MENSTGMRSSYLDTNSNFVWWPELGMGFHPAPAMEYRDDYWQEYRRRDATDTGAALTRARIDLVRRHFSGVAVDIGIGGGRFVEESGSRGFDVNARAVEWLDGRGSLCDPYSQKVDAITCWDSLEHIPDPTALLRQVRQWIFVSLPIFSGPDHALKSRHYKPGEHIWYWTHDGLVKWCADHGFSLVECNDMETQLGREGIMSYAFRRSDD